MNNGDGYLRPQEKLKGNFGMAKKVKVALVGFGTVGTGVVRILQTRGEEISRKTGLTFELAHVVDMDIQRNRGLTLADGVLHDDLVRAVGDDQVDIAVELVGGTGIAGQIVMDMLKSGKDVVTANKALLAERGEEIFATARQQGRCVAFEASCGGGIPLVSSIRS